MTFDEWLVEYNKQQGLPPAHVVAEAAWNAAVDACMIQSCRNIGVALALRTDLEALKTPLEGSNDSEVRAS